MGDITRLDSFRERKPEYVYQCACTGQHFYLNHDGTIACRSCKQIVEKVEWIYRDLKP